MQPVIYDADERYPGPSTYPPPEYVAGIPIQAELDAYPRMFTWGELKGIIRELELLIRMLSRSVSTPVKTRSEETCTRDCMPSHMQRGG